MIRERERDSIPLQDKVASYSIRKEQMLSYEQHLHTYVFRCCLAITVLPLMLHHLLRVVSYGLMVAKDMDVTCSPRCTADKDRVSVAMNNLHAFYIFVIIIFGVRLGMMKTWGVTSSTRLAICT